MNVGQRDVIQVRLGQLDRGNLTGGNGIRHLCRSQLGQFVRRGHESVLRQDARNPESAKFGGRSLRQHTISGQRRDNHILTKHIDQLSRVRGRRNADGRHLLHARDSSDDHIELPGEVIELVIGERQPGQLGEVGDLVAGNGHSGHLRGELATGPTSKATSASGRPARPDLEPCANSL